MSKMLQSTRRQVYIYVCSVSKSCCVAIPDYLTEPIHWSEASRGESEQPAAAAPPQGAGVPPERIVKVQIDVQAVDEELPVSWVNAHGLAEVLKEWDQGGIESVLGNPKFLFTFPPNWIDVKCMNVLVQNIIQIETAFHS